MACIAIARTEASLVMTTLLQDVGCDRLERLALDRLLARAVGRVLHKAITGRKLVSVLVHCIDVNVVETGIAGINVWRSGRALAAVID